MKIRLRNADYDVLKWLVVVFLPAFELLVGTIGTALHWEHTQVCLVIMAAVTTFLGSVLGVSNHQYRKEHDDDNNHTGLG